MSLSFRQARKMGHDYIGVEHVILAILWSGQGVAFDILTGHFHIDPDELRIRIEDALDERPPHEGRIENSPRTKKMLKYAEIEMRDFGHSNVATEHLLLAVAIISEGLIAEIFSEMGITPLAIRSAIRAHLGLGEAKRSPDDSFLKAASPHMAGST